MPGAASPQAPAPTQPMPAPYAGMTEPAAMSSAVTAPLGLDAFASAPSESPLDLDVTVLAFAQWVSEMKSRQANAQNQLRAEMSMIRNAISSNHMDLSDFKRHGAAIQQQMQSETNEIRESLSGVFMEITSAVRNNSAADQDIKLKIQSLNEQAVRNETCFAQLAEAADQSQSKLRSAVTEMQLSSERMRDELSSLTRHSENLEGTVSDRGERISADMEQLTQDLYTQLERRREHLRKMVNDVVSIGESLQGLVTDLGEQRNGADGAQNRIQSSLYSVDQTLRQEIVAGGCGQRGSLAATVDAVPPQQQQPQQQRYTSGLGACAAQQQHVAAAAPRAPGPAGAGLAGMGHHGGCVSAQHAAHAAAYGQARPMPQMAPMVYHR